MQARNPSFRQALPTRLSVEQVAERLGIGRIAVYNMLERGIIPAIRLGRRWLITRMAFEKWEKSCGQPAPTRRPPARAQ